MIKTKKKIKSKKKLSTNKSTNYLNSLNNHTIEFTLLLSSLMNHIILLKIMKKNNSYIKNEIKNVLIEIREKGDNSCVPKNTKDKDLDYIINIILNSVSSLISQSKLKLKGGFYFRDIEDKADEPITGKDVSRLLDEIQDLFYNLQYIDEGKFLREVYVLLSLLRGETGDLKQYLTWSIFPQYYQITPPFIRWDTWKKAFDNRKYEDLPDYLLAYQKYNKARDEYLVSKGLKSPSVLQKDLYVGKFNTLANALDQNILKFQQLRTRAQLRMPLQVF